MQMFKDDTIPEEFHSSLSGKPIENCIMCGKYLLDENVTYFIEKAVKQGNTEFEYAICMDCSANMKGAMSEESMQRLESYFAENNQFEVMQNRLSMKESVEPRDFYSHCIIKGIPLTESDEFQLVGYFTGKKIHPQSFPFAICFAAGEEMGELLSEQTRREMDGFIDNFIGIPPDWIEIIKTNKPVLI
jgi:hypothetical protein